MDKPIKEKFGYHTQCGFDDEPSGWLLEGGEEAYYEAMKQWKLIEDNKMENNLKIKNIMITACMTDGSYRLIETNKDQQLMALEVMIHVSKDKSISLSKEPIEGVSWESDIDLTK